MISTFDGKEVYWWLINVEVPEKLSWDVMALRGDALKWWFCWKESNQNETWQTFEKAVLKRFQTEVDPELPVFIQDEEAEIDLELGSLAYQDGSKKSEARRSEIDTKKKQENRRKDEVLKDEEETALVEAKTEIKLKLFYIRGWEHFCMVRVNRNSKQ